MKQSSDKSASSTEEPQGHLSQVPVTEQPSIPSPRRLSSPQAASMPVTTRDREKREGLSWETRISSVDSFVAQKLLNCPGDTARGKATQWFNPLCPLRLCGAFPVCTLSPLQISLASHSPPPAVGMGCCKSLNPHSSHTGSLGDFLQGTSILMLLQFPQHPGYQAVHFWPQPHALPPQHWESNAFLE